MDSYATISHFIAQAPAGSTQDQGQGSGSLPIIMMVLMFVMMYFLLIRPQRKQQKEHQLRIAALKIGDKIVTSSGIHGLVSNVKDSTITVKIADNVKVEMEKTAVASVTKKSEKTESEPVEPVEPEAEVTQAKR